ncbi:MAG TPA: hypothetical protein VMS56_10190 [Thermoanaerobaculia bacterium]|nr:hypothetical protein [Thermoanaerobaculia bacterium]
MRKLSIVLFSILISIPAFAGWSRAGLYGADVRALAADPDDPDLLFLGTSQGEIYASKDGGASWSNPRFSNPFPGYVVDNLMVDARGRLWAAAWGLWGGSVVAVSEDQGKSWSRRDTGLDSLSVRAFAVDPSEPQHLVAGALEGVYASKDDGASWRKISDQVNVGSVAIDPRGGDTIYVGTWRQAWRTDDGGRSWKHVAKGMVLDTDVFAININPANPDEVWLSTCGWVYSSADRGDTWNRHKDGFDNRRIHAIERDPEVSGTVYAGSVAGLYRTSDSGKGWKLVSPDSLVVTAIVVHPGRPERIVVATEGDGVYVSPDRGESWHRSSHGLYNVKVASVTPDPVREHRVYATVFFGGTSSGLYVSDDGGANWSRLNETPLPEILTLMVRQKEQPKFLAGTPQGFWWSMDGVKWERSEPRIVPIRVEKMVEYSASRLFAATALGVYTSKDGGKGWYPLGSEDRTVDLALGWIAAGPALYALTESGLRVFDGESWSRVEGAPERGRTLAVRRHGNRDLVVVAGSRGVEAGMVDAVKRWIPSKAPRGEHGSVHAAPHSGGTLFVTFNGRHEIHLLDGKASAWKTVGVPTTLRDVAGVAADPFESRRFFLGTHGQGILIWDESESRAAVEPALPQLAGAGGAK